MSLDDVVAEVESRYFRQPAGSAPEEDGRPDPEPQPTSLSTPDMLPPWLHTQTLMARSSTSILLVVSLIGLLWYINEHRHIIERGSYAN